MMRKNLLLISAIFFAIAITKHSQAQSLRTPTFSGNSTDFNAAERYASVDNVDYYCTYDATYIYFGAFRTSSNTWGAFDHFTVYVDDVGSGTGSATGVTWDGNTPTLPFASDYRIAIRRNGSGESFYSNWNGASWTTGGTNGQGWSQFTTASSNGALEVRVPWSDLGNPDAIRFIMYNSYTTGYFGYAPNGTSGAGPSGSTQWFGSIGTKSADCVPTNTTNLTLTAATLTNSVPAAAGTYARVIVNTGTVTNTNNWTLAPGGIIEVSGGTFAFGTQTVTFGNSATSNGKGTTVNTSGSGSITTTANTVWDFGGEGNITGNALSLNGSVRIRNKFTPLASGNLTFASGGSLDIRNGGFVNTNAPTYAAGSTLMYNTASTYTASTEWTPNALTGVGVPANVTIGNLVAASVCSFGTSAQYRRLTGNLLINTGAGNGLTLSSVSGGDLRVGGNWTNSATFTANTRAVYFDGTAAQTINATATFAYVFISNTTATVTSAATFTATSSLTVDAGARLDLGTNALTLTGSTSVVNGFLRRGGTTSGTLTGVSATTLTFSSTGTYEHNFTTTGGTIPTATWSSGSTCLVMGYTSIATAMSGAGQTFSNFTVNCPNMSGTCNVQLNTSAAMTVNGTFSVLNTNGQIFRLASSGSYTLNVGDFVINSNAANTTLNLSNAATATINISGNFSMSQTANTASLTSTAGTSTINFNKSTGTQTFTQSAGTISGTIGWNVGTGVTTNTLQLLTNANLGTGTGTFTSTNNARTDFQNFVLSGSGTFAAATGTTLISANTAGINTSGASGSVQTTTRTLTNTGVNYTFNAGAAQNTGTAIGAATNIQSLTINNSSGVTAGASAVLSSTGVVTFTSGLYDLSTLNLTMTSGASFSGVASSRYVKTSSTGRLLQTVGGTAVSFPVGNSAYNPLTLTNSGTSDVLGIRVVDGSVANANDATKAVNRAWVVTEAVAGGSTLTAVAQYNSGEEGTNYNAGSSPKIGFWKGSNPWTEVSATLAGAGPYTATAGATISPADMTSGTQYFAVGKDDALAVPVVNYTWTGSTSTDWATSSNWSPTGVPTTFDNVTISSPGTNTLSINSSRTINDFTVSGTGTFNMTSAGSLTVNGNLSSSTSAAVSLDCASTFNVASTSAQTIPAWAFGNLNATGGNRTLVASGTIGICGAFTPGAGTYTVTGSTVDFNGTGAQTVNAFTFNNLTISGNRGGAAITLASGTTNIGGNGSCTASNNTWVNTGSTFVYNATGAQTVAAISGYNNLTISGARGGATVTLEAGTIGVGGTFSPTATAVTYSSTGNTFDYTSAGAQSIAAFNKYNNLSNSGNGNRTLPTAATVVIDGAYTPTTGTITVSTSVIDFSSASSQNIPASSYYTITNSGNGNRVWASSGNIDINGSFTPGSGTHTITGSTVRFLNVAAGPTTIPVVTSNIAGSSYNNVVINGSNAVPSVFTIIGTTVGIASDLTVTAGHLRLTTTGNTGTLNVNGLLTMNGGSIVLTNSGNVGDVGTLNLLGNLVMTSGTIGRTSSVANGVINFAHPTATQTWTYSGGSFSILSGFGIPVNVGTGSSTNALQLASNVTASSITVNVLSGSTINFGTNVFSSSGSMSFNANSGSNVITANAGGLAATGATGSVQCTGSRTYNAGANYVYNGSVVQATGTGLTGANNLTLNNTSGSTPAITLSVSASVGGTLTLTAGILQLGANNLTLTSNSTSAISGGSSTEFIQTNSTGELRRAIAGSIGSSSVYNFPVGTSTNFTPAQFSFSATGNAFTLHARAVGSTHPSMNSNGTQTDYFANRYWVTNTSGTPSTYSYTSQFTHVSGDAQGTVANIRLNKWSGSWSEDSGSSATSTVLSSGSLNETSFSLSSTAEWTGRVNPSIVTYTWNGSVSSDWANPNNWTPNTSVAGPTFIDNVIISSVGTNLLTINSSRTITDFTLSGTGDFTITSAGSLTITGAITSTSSATPALDCASTVTISNSSAQTIPAWSYGNLNASGGNRTLASSGTIGICGTFTPGAGAYTVTGSTVNFNGNGAQPINAMSYNNLTVSQNRGGATVTLASGTISVLGVFNPTLSNYTPSYTGNTIDFAGGTTQGIPAFTYNNITNTGNAARTWASSGTIDVNGTFAFGTGAHTTTGSTVRYSSTAATGYSLASFTSATANHYHNLEFVGGASTTWVLASGFSPSISGNLTMSGAGLFTMATNATANNMNVGGNFLITGTGTVRVANTTTAGLVNTLTVTGNTNISSGVLNLSGSANSTTVQGLLATTDLNITGTGQLILDAANNTALGSATVNGNFTLSSTTANAVNFGSGAGSNTNNLINIKGNFSKSGTGTIGMTGGFATSAGFNFNGTGTQTWSHAGTAMTGGVITIASGSTVQLLTNMINASSASANAITVAGTLDCSTFTASASNATNTFSLAATGKLITASSSGVAGAVTGYTPAPSFASGATFEFDGSNPSTGFASYTGITASNAYTLNWTGTGSLTLDKTVQLNALNLTSNGFFYLGNFDVTLTSSATIGGSPFSASKMIVTNGSGYLIRNHSNIGGGIPFTWPIGDTTGVADYAPVTISNLSVSLAGTIAFRVVDGVHPNMSPATSYVSRYWPSRYTGGTTYNYTNASFTYTSGDIVVGPEASLKSNVWDPVNSGWIDFSATSSAASNVLTLTSGPNQTNMPQSATNIYDHTARIDVPVYYRSAATGNWTSTPSTTWEISTDPTFVSPAPVPATVAPNATNSAGITIRNTHTVTANTSLSADQIVVQSGGVLSVTANSFTVANGTGTDLTVAAGGTIQFSSATNNSLIVATGSALQIDGLFRQSSTASPDVTNNGTITIGATGTYQHARNAGIIPTCAWTSGSTCLLTGITNNTPTGLGQSFHHFTVNSTLTASVNCSGALQTVLGKMKVTTNHATNEFRLSTGSSYTLTITDSLIINNGFMSITSGGAGPCNIVANGPTLITGNSTLAKTGAATGNFTFNNNFQLDSGSTFEFNSAGSSNTTANFRGNVIMNGTVLRTNGGTHTINFDKSSGNQTWTCNATFGSGLFNWNIGGAGTTNTVQLLSNVALSTSAHVFTVLNGATLNMGPYILTGTNTAFTVNATGAIKLGHASGIVTAPTADGNVRTLTRNFPGTASYFYNGTANQVTGNALPTTLTGTGNLNIEASTGIIVTLTSNNTTTPTFNLISGLFAAGNTQQLNITSGGTVNATSGDWVTGVNAGVLNFPGTGTFTGNSNPYNVYASGGVNFGSGTVTIQNGGTFRINFGGFVNTNAPFYATGSTLQYNTTGVYGRGLEWSTTTGRGYPHHVQISNATTLNPANTAAVNANVPMRTAGNVTIDATSNIYMDSGGNNMLEDLRVGGDLILLGSLAGSQTAGSDIYVAGNWQNDGASVNFFPNSRAVFLNGTGTQTISGTNTSFPAFPFLFIDKTAGGVTLSRDIQVTTSLTFTTANTAIVNAATYTVYVSNNASGAIDRQGLGHVNGNLRRAMATGTNTYNFTIGDTTIYAPVSITANGVSVAGSMTAFTTIPDHPQLASSGIDATKSVNRYWTISQTGLTLTNFDPTFNFVAGDLDGGVNTSNLQVGRYSSGWTYPTVGTRTSTSTQATGETNYGEFALAECKTPATFTVTGGGSYCAGGSGVAVGLTGSETWVSYQLQLNGSNTGSPVTGTGSAFNFANQTAAGVYTVVATNLSSTSCTSNMTGSVLVTIIPTVAPTVSITATPGNTICTGASITFEATPQFGGTTPTYQWQVNGTNVGTNDTLYTSAALSNGDLVRCIMTSSETCPVPAADTSNVITMTVLAYQTPSISISASPSITICGGDLVTFTAVPVFGGGTPSYQWKLNGSNVGSNSSTYSSTTLANGDQIECELTSDYLCLITPTANSNVLTMAVTAAPQVDAGSAMSTCGLTPYTFSNGASNSNTTGISWTENGAGSITAGATTLTPTYTPAAGDLGNTVTFTLTGTGNAPCATIIDQVTLVVNPLVNWYVDADSDGFGAPGIPIAACSNPGGRVTNNSDCCDSNADINPLTEWWADVDGDGYGSFVFDNGCFTGVGCSSGTWFGLIPYYPGAHANVPYALDCNDSNINANPGASEICGNGIDDDCNGTTDVGCSVPVNDSFTNASQIAVNNANAYYPNCQLSSGTVYNANISAQGNPANVSIGAGRDVWYKFIAPSTGVQIKVQPTGFNAVIELRTAAHPVGQIDVENANPAVGGLEILNTGALTAGVLYYVGVRNYDATNVGTFTICVSPLLQSGCGLTIPAGGFSLCANYKAIYRGASSYTFNFTGTGGSAAFPYVTTIGTTTGLIPLSTPALDIRYGGIYTCRVDANYNLLNGMNVADPTITVVGSTSSANCTGITIMSQPQIEVRASQRCPAVLTRSSYLVGNAVSGNTIICGATSYIYRFTQVTNCTGSITAGIPFTVTTSGNTPFLSLAAAFPTPTYPLPNLGYWKVEIAPVFSYGTGSYGPPQIIQVTNTSTSAMLPEMNQGIEAEKMLAIQTDAAIYPNPNSGDLIQLNATGINEEVIDFKLSDSMGRLIEERQFGVTDGSLNTTYVFEGALTNGVYFVELRAGEYVFKEKLIIQK